MTPSPLFTQPSQPVMLQNAPISGPEATLFVFQPRHIPTQVIRPYLYNFGGDFVQHVISSRGMIESVGIGMPSIPCVGNAIVPSSDGIVINTDALSACWTFLLIIDDVSASGCKLRTITSGFFNEEPVNSRTMQLSATPTMNPDAILHFLTYTVLQLETSVGLMQKDNLGIRAASDLTPAITEQFANGTPLFLMNPRRLIKGATLNSGDEQISMFGDASIRNLHAHAAVIQASSRSPIHQLRDIGTRIDAGEFLGTNNGCIVSSLTSPSLAGLSNESSVFESIIKQEFSSHDDTTFLPGGRITANVPTPLSVIDMMFPNLKVQCIGIPFAQNLDIKPQTDISPKTVLSYLAVNTIRAIASNFGINDIAFRYCSFGSDAFNRKQGMGELYSVGMVCPLPDQNIRYIVERFMYTLRSDLWPLIKTVAGEFDIMCHYDGCGETMIDLNLMDFHKENGLFVTNGKMGGLTVPLIGTENQFMHNSQELGDFISSMSAHFLAKRGTQSFPQIDTFNTFPQPDDR